MTEISRETFHPVTWEDAAELNRQCRLAEKVEWTGFCYGVSASLKRRSGECVSVGQLEAVERHFRVTRTPTVTDPGHLTIELPKPVTPAVARLFNELFGRTEP